MVTRKNTGLYLDQDVVARVRAAVAALEGTPDDLGGLSAIVDDLLAAEADRIERVYNDGQPFPEVPVRTNSRRRG